MSSWWTPALLQPGEGSFNSTQMIWAILPFIGVFYLHSYWLIPVYLFRKRRVPYILWTVLAIFATAALSTLSIYMGTIPAAKPYHLAVLRRVFPVTSFMLASASLAAFRQNFRLEKDRKEKETEHLRTELSFLRIPGKLL